MSDVYSSYIVIVKDVTRPSPEKAPQPEHFFLEASSASDALTLVEGYINGRPVQNNAIERLYQYTVKVATCVHVPEDTVSMIYQL